MNRPYVVAGNWKMNLDKASALTLSESLSLVSERELLKVMVFPPFPLIDAVSTVLKATSISVGAQTLHHAVSGAFTGEVSADMIQSVGADSVILGHSERRELFGETDALVNDKLRVALEKGLRVIVCVGESHEQRQNNEVEAVIQRQLQESLKDVSSFENLMIAYEPIWAIGTGNVATPEQAQSVHQMIRRFMSDVFSTDVAESISILYGGSVKPENTESLIQQEDIDGFLVGGASLASDSFLSIIDTVSSIQA